MREKEMTTMTTDEKLKIDLDEVERVKEIRHDGQRAIRVCYEHGSREYADHGGKLYEAFRTLGVYCC